MKPKPKGKTPVMSKPEEYEVIGDTSEWIVPLQNLSYTTIDKLKEVDNLGYWPMTSTATRIKTSWICQG